MCHQTGHAESKGKISAPPDAARTEKAADEWMDDRGDEFCMNLSEAVRTHLNLPNSCLSTCSPFAGFPPPVGSRVSSYRPYVR
eukprot:6845726-Prymnesium_polylepis.2